MHSTNAAKYADASPIVGFLLQRFLRALTREAAQAPVRRLVDFGCGEGFVAEALLRELQCEYFGIDVRQEAIEQAKLRAPGGEFRLGDLLKEPPRPDTDLLVMVEVLEHLADPAAALRAIERWHPRRVLLSVPWEPFFRAGNFARGRWWSRLGNHPEHCQQFTPSKLRRLLRQSFPNRRVTVRTCFPWLLATIA